MIRLGGDAVILTAEEVNAICRIFPSIFADKPKSKEGPLDFAKRCQAHDSLVTITDLQQCDKYFQRYPYDD